MSDKLINTFHLRRKLNADIEALSATISEADQLEQVRAMVKKYDPDLILTTVRKFLDTSSSQLRGGLGRLASLLPYEDVTALLRHEAANRNNPTQARLTAALILERFLQADLPPALMSDLKDPEVVVMQSLQEAIDASKQNRYVLLDYVRQMRQENEDVAYMVLNLLDQLPPEERPEMLRLIAYDTRPGVAKTALERLAALRQPPVATQAAEALYTLQFNLPPAMAEVAERNLRKLRFSSGVVYEPPEMSGWRALLTPCTLNGEQELWFLRTEKSTGILIGLRVDVNRGLLEMFGSEEVDPRYLPSKRKVGEMISIAMTSGTPMVFLEVPPAYAGWHLRQILANHWRQSPAQPLPGEYTLHNPLLFRYQSPQLESTLADLFASGAALWETDAPKLTEVSAELLRHPALGGWFFQERVMKEALLHTSSQNSPVEIAALVPSLMAQMFADPHAKSVAASLQTILKAQAGWLAIAGQERNARHAILVAESFEHVPIQQHPFIALMVEVGLVLMINRR